MTQKKLRVITQEFFKNTNLQNAQLKNSKNPQSENPANNFCHVD